MAPRRPETLIGREIAGQFRLDQYLGRGRSTLVFAAADLVTGDVVAIKLLASSLTGDEGFMRRFRHVMRAASALDHPNVLRVLAWGEERELFVVTELMAGPVRSLIGPSGGLSGGQTAAMAVDASRGLAFLADRDLVHRRLHPSNLLVSHDGRVVVADAGLSWMIAHQSGHQFSDFRYLAPEAGSGTTGPPLDVYALGLIMAEVLSGDIPLLASDVNATLGTRHDRNVVVDTGWGRIGRAIGAAGRADPGRRVPAAQLDIGLMALIDQLEQLDGDRVALPRIDPSVRSDELEAMRLTMAGRAPAAPVERPTPAAPAQPTPSTRAVDQGSSRQRRPDTTVIADLPGVGTRPQASDEPQQPQKPEEPEQPKEPKGPSALDVQVALWRRRLGLPPRPGDEPEGDPDPNAATLEELATRRNWVLGVAGALIVVFMLIFGVQRLVLSSAGTVPNLVGATVAEAREEASEQRWRLNVEEVRRDGTEVDEVLAQQPAEGTTLEAGDSLDVTVSLGQTLVELPDLDGLPADDAEAVITFVGMELGEVTSEFNTATKSGVVLSYDAPATEDGKLPKGSEVNLVISDGARPRKVPADLKGEKSEDVVKALEKVSLKPVVDKVQDPDVPLGYVVSVEPASGTEVEYQSDVIVRVSSPREKAIVPDLAGKSTLQADADLRDVGLNVLGIQGPPGSPVRRTIPEAGAEVSQGTAVRLVTE